MSLRTTRTLVSVCAVVLVLSAVVPAWAEASLRGTAKDEQGKPIPGVEVKMLPAVDDFMTLTAKSNKKGKFVFGLIRPTDYRLVAFVDGMRIVRMDINVAEPDDDDFWGFHEDTPSGAETPSFRLTGLSKVTCDLVFAPHDGDPGVYGTGLPISPVALITAQIAEGKMDEALKSAEESVKRDPESATFNYLHAFVLRYAERYDEALAAVNKTIEIDDGFEGANLLKGKILADRGDLEESLEFFQQEAEWASSESVHRDALLEMTVVYEKLEQFDEAVATLEELIVIAPDHAGAHKELADLYLRLGHQEKAQAMMEKVVALGASDPNLLYNLGAERFNASDFETAASYFERTIELAPDFTDAYLRLAYTQLNLGRTEDAKNSLAKFLELSPEDNPEVPTARAIHQQLSNK